MPINVGYIEHTHQGGDVVLRVYYDNAGPPSPDQPLVDGPRGYCLDLTNVSGRPCRLDLRDGQGGLVETIQVGKGDPVETGSPSGRSRNAAALAQLGFTTRGDVQNITSGT